MSHRLTEPRAWREIAKRISEREWRETGLCSEVDRLYQNDWISDNTLCQMHDRIQLYLSNKIWAYPYGEEYGEARILAALWLALEAEEKN